MSTGHVEIRASSLEEAPESLEFTLAMIEQIIGGTAIRAPWKQIRKLLDNLTKGHPWWRYPLSANYTIYRGRVDRDTDTFSNTKDLSFRNPECVKDHGRCHKPGVSVFYGASNLDTVLSELSPDIGDWVHVSLARVKQNRTLRVTAIGEIEHVRRYGRALIGNETTKRMIQELLDNANDESSIKTILMDAFLSELFILPAKTPKEYKATNALSDILFSIGISNEKGHPIRIDGFAYPSVQHRGGVNYAIRSDRFSECMEIYHCMAFEIINYLGFGIYGRKKYAESTAIDTEGNIEWKLL